MAMTVKKTTKKYKSNGELQISVFQTTKSKNVTEDQDIHAFPSTEEKTVSRIGSTFGKTNRVIIDTDDHQYIIYTHNDKKSL